MRGRGRGWLFGKDSRDKEEEKGNHVESGYLGKKMEIRGRKKITRENGKRKRNRKKMKIKPIKRIEKKKNEINRNNWETGMRETIFFSIILYKMINVSIFFIMRNR